MNLTDLIWFALFVGLGVEIFVLGFVVGRSARENRGGGRRA